MPFWFRKWVGWTYFEHKDLPDDFAQPRWYHQDVSWMVCVCVSSVVGKNSAFCERIWSIHATAVELLPVKPYEHYGMPTDDLSTCIQIIVHCKIEFLNGSSSQSRFLASKRFPQFLQLNSQNLSPWHPGCFNWAAAVSAPECLILETLRRAGLTCFLV